MNNMSTRKNDIKTISLVSSRLDKGEEITIETRGRTEEAEPLLRKMMERFRNKKIYNPEENNMCNCTINCTDVVEIKELAYKSVEALYKGTIPYEEFTTEKGKLAFDAINEGMKPMGINSMKELFDHIIKEVKDLKGVEINLEDFM